MGYGVSQSYGFSLPTESVDGQKLWVITEYGLPELWVKTELTVCVSNFLAICTVISMYLDSGLPIYPQINSGTI